MNLLPRHITIFLFSLLLFLTLMGALAISAVGESFSDVILMFNMDREASVPTWFATILLFFLFGTTTFIAIVETLAQNMNAVRWRWLSFIFLLMSMEEIAGFREDFITPQFRALFDLGGIFFFGWVIPIGILTLVFISIYAKFIWNLPKRVRNFLIIGIAIYVGGAIGIELISSAVVTETTMTGYERFSIFIRVTLIEEVFEFTGSILMLHALLLYIYHHTWSIIPEIDITNSVKWIQTWSAYRRDLLLLATISLTALVALLMIP